MDEARYHQRVAGVFQKMLRALDDIDPDLLESDATSDMLTITAADGQKCIVNTQRAVQQIWVAGKGQGIHFSYRDSDGQWMDDKGKNLELFSFVASVVEEISGVKLAF